MTMGPLGTANANIETQRINLGAGQPEVKTGLVMTREGAAGLFMTLSTLLIGVGAGWQWGVGAGFFSAGIAIGVIAILLAMGN